MELPTLEEAPESTLLGQGTFAEVHRSGDLAQKHCREFGSTVREIAITRMLDHPCIIRYSAIDRPSRESVVDRPSCESAVDRPSRESAVAVPECVDTISQEDKAPAPVLLVLSMPLLRPATDWIVSAPPAHEVVSVVRGVAAALAHIHSRGFIHGDVKPANILVRVDEAGVMQPVLADFGSALPCGGAGRLCPWLHYTIGYRAPWISRSVTEAGEPYAYNHASDVWALGCTIASVFGPPLMRGGGRMNMAGRVELDHDRRVPVTYTHFDHTPMVCYSLGVRRIAPTLAGRISQLGRLSADRVAAVVEKRYGAVLTTRFGATAMRTAMVRIIAKCLTFSRYSAAKVVSRIDVALISAGDIDSIAALSKSQPTPSLLFATPETWWMPRSVIIHPALVIRSRGKYESTAVAMLASALHAAVVKNSDVAASLREVADSDIVADPKLITICDAVAAALYQGARTIGLGEARIRGIGQKTESMTAAEIARCGLELVRAINIPAW